jgi:hypothetical protein
VVETGQFLKVDRQNQCHFISAGSYERRRQERIGLRGPETGPHKAKALTTNVGCLANAYKEHSRDLRGSLDLTAGSTCRLVESEARHTIIRPMASCRRPNSHC